VVPYPHWTIDAFAEDASSKKEINDTLDQHRGNKIKMQMWARAGRASDYSEFYTIDPA
jgi:hypothetical protein